jgi:hypothetical protein
MYQAIEPALQENKNHFIIFSMKQNNVWKGVSKREVSI